MAQYTSDVYEEVHRSSSGYAEAPELHDDPAVAAAAASGTKPPPPSQPTHGGNYSLVRTGNGLNAAGTAASTTDPRSGIISPIIRSASSPTPGSPSPSPSPSASPSSASPSASASAAGATAVPAVAAGSADVADGCPAGLFRDFFPGIEVGKELGKGAGGTVYKGQWGCNTVALKRFHNFEALAPEASMMTALHHINVVQAFGYYEDTCSPTPDAVGRNVYLVMEYLPAGSLQCVLQSSGALSKEQQLRFCVQVAQGMHFLHSIGIVHRDLRSANVLVERRMVGEEQEMLAKISDFGLAVRVPNYQFYGKRGELIPVRFSAPEALCCRHSCYSDIWSFGVLLWEIYTRGALPYSEIAALEAVIAAICRGVKLKPPADTPIPMVTLMNECWQMQPQARPRFSHIVERLVHGAYHTVATIPPIAPSSLSSSPQSPLSASTTSALLPVSSSSYSYVAPPSPPLSSVTIPPPPLRPVPTALTDAQRTTSSLNKNISSSSSTNAGRVPIAVSGATTAALSSLDDARHPHGQLILIWVDSNFTVGENPMTRQRMIAEMPFETREVITLVSSDQLKVWLETHSQCLVHRELRIVTNRNRPQDGGERAGEELIGWLRAADSPWRTVPLLMYCGNRQPVAYLHKPKTRVWVSTHPRMLDLFCRLSLKELIDRTCRSKDKEGEKEEEDDDNGEKVTGYSTSAAQPPKKPSPKLKGTDAKKSSEKPKSKSKDDDDNGAQSGGGGGAAAAAAGDAAGGKGPTLSSTIKKLFK